jgi:hypothetical protein
MPYGLQVLGRVRVKINFYIYFSYNGTQHMVAQGKKLVIISWKLVNEL